MRISESVTSIKPRRKRECSHTCLVKCLLLCGLNAIPPVRDFAFTVISTESLAAVEATIGSSLGGFTLAPPGFTLAAPGASWWGGGVAGSADPRLTVLLSSCTTRKSVRVCGPAAYIRHT